MTDPTHDSRLPEQIRGLLSDAVSDVEPHDALDSIRSRTKVTPMSSRNRSGRPWRYALLGAAATAAVIGGIAYAGGGHLSVTGDEDDTSAAGAPARHRSSGGHQQGSQTPQSAGASTSSLAPQTVAAYYVGDTPQGPRLYREFDQVAAESKLAGALALLTRTPTDPDYTTPWPDGAFADASYDGDVVTVDLADASLHDRPAGMSADEAQTAVQQVVYTMQAAVQARAAVQFRLDGNPVDQVLGVATSEPVANAPQLDALSLVSITAPEQGSGASGTLDVSGVANSFEANVPWQILQGDQVVKEGYVTAEGAYGNELYPWHDQIDVSKLAAGDYTFRAQTDDPSDGEGKGPFVDTRTFTVQ
jgi:Immunoglobulin-like domain of bacterial spore germination/Sporulation and spore germination